ncbi:MAG TPA: Gfo/Idh/MocA family oxidoreductase [Planctomycetes bacterium]|nr:Gfo/Idh/MocA family oxidoreductase [Planctomycetota bacterium]
MAVKVGVIGAGGAGRLLHLPAFKEVPDAEVVALADAREERVKAVADQYGVPKRFTDYRKLLEEELDMVTIGLPNHLHCEVATAALKAGKHVVTEKPLSDTLAAARKMVEAAHSTGKRLFMGVQNRFRYKTQYIREMVLKGKLGEVYHVDCSIMRRRGYPGMGSWFTDKKLSGGGCLLDIGVHVLDMAWYMACEPRAERASGAVYARFGHLPRKPSNFGDYDQKGTVDVDDFAVGVIHFEGGASLSLHVSWAANGPQSGFKVHLYGTKAGVGYDPFIIYGEEQGLVTDAAPQLELQENAYAEEMKHFIAVIQGKAEPVVMPEKAFEVQAMLDAVYKSAASGKEAAVEKL